MYRIAPSLVDTNCWLEWGYKEDEIDLPTGFTNTFLSLLGYAARAKAINTLIEKENKCTLTEIMDQLSTSIADSVVASLADDCGIRDFVFLAKSYMPPEKLNIRSDTVFINRAGIFQLIRGSRISKAKEFTAWIDNDVLPTPCNRGEYVVTGCQ